MENYETYLLCGNKKYYRNGHHIHSFLCLCSNYLIDTSQVIKLHGFYNCKDRITLSVYTSFVGSCFLYNNCLFISSISQNLLGTKTSCNNSTLLFRYVIRMICNVCFRCEMSLVSSLQYHKHLEIGSCD